MQVGDELASDLSTSKEQLEQVRYLLVSSGCAVCLLELKKEPLSNVCCELSVLPEIASLKLIEHHLPVSVGLINLGSDPYIIGGHPFVESKSTYYFAFEGIPRNCGRYKRNLPTTPLEGTSTEALKLALIKDEDGHRRLFPESGLSFFRPKFWPAVVEVDGKIHVFDSDPSGCVIPAAGWMFSHDVVTDGVGLMHIETSSLPLFRFIRKYLVLGSFIYAVAGDQGILFDSEKMKWEEVGGLVRHCGYDDSPVFAKSVFDLLWLSGLCWKIGEIGVGVDLHHVILVFYNRDTTVVIGFLVSSTTGEVACSQFLKNFFPPGSRIKPCYVHSGTMIKADDEGKTFCGIINAYGPSLDYDSGYDSKKGSLLFIFDFKVKPLITNVTEYLAKKIPRMRIKFLRIDVKETYAFEANSEFDKEPGDFYSRFVGIQAIFMDKSFVDGKLVHS